MKTQSIYIGLFAIALLFSCGKKEEKPVENNETTEAVIIEKEVVTDTVKEEEPDGTSVKIGTDGASIETKDGSKSTSVEISKDKATIEVEK